MADAQAPSKPPPIVVAVDKEGNVTVDGELMTESDVLKRVAEKQAESQKPEAT